MERLVHRIHPEQCVERIRYGCRGVYGPAPGIVPRIAIVGILKFPYQ